jgi:hypothetical protein
VRLDLIKNKIDEIEPRAILAAFDEQTCEVLRSGRADQRVPLLFWL